MASIQDIELLLKRDISSLYDLLPGIKKPHINRHYHIPNEYYVIKLFNSNNWIIVDDSDDTRDILKDNTVHSVSNYGQILTSDGRIRSWAELKMNMKDIEYKNNCPYDNRLENLITHRYNIIKKGTSKYISKYILLGHKKGVSRCTMKGHDYWRVSIVNHEGNTMRKYYNISMLGHDEAEYLAIKERERLETIYGYV